MAVNAEQIQIIFAAAAETRDLVARAALLDRECGDDVALRRRVELLLKAHDDSGGLPDAAPTGFFDASIREGASVAGRYKLLELIGEGGMGAVWLAEQTEPVKRKVALKLVKPGMDSKAVLARFEAERQALALMDHPNIARVHDGGATEQGRPYFVMELVKGLPLTEYCDARRMSVRERLDLFVPICSAVQHAHQKGIIHRDLKPSNILVTEHDGRPVPKVIDFGLAKALGAATTLTDRTLHTAFGTVVGTPLYMAPEQVAVNALDVDTRSDIYSLGVILYELLTGTTPLEKQRFKEAAWEEVRRVIREEEPPKPSARLSDSHDALPSISAQRHIEPAALTKLVRGELDWIVMKALEKDRNRRYETANGFSMDVQRYLAGEVVQACPPSALYRVKKFARRNRTVVTAASLVLASLVAGVVGTSIGMWRAEKQRVEAEQARDGEAKAKGEAVKTKDEALAEKKKAEAAETQTLAEFQASTDDAIEQLIGSKPELGPQERTYLEKTLKRWQVFADRQGDDERSMAVRAEGHHRVGTLWRIMGRLDEARKEGEISRELAKKLVAQYPAPKYQFALSGSHNELGRVLRTLGEFDLAWKEHEAARDLQKNLVAQHPTVSAYQKGLSQSHVHLGNMLMNRRELDAALKEYEAARDLQKNLVAQHPTATAIQQELAITHGNLGMLLYDLGDRGAARKEVETAQNLWKKLVALIPDDPACQRGLASSHTNLGILLNALGDRGAARKEYEAARDIWKKQVDQYPSVKHYQIELGGAYCNFGLLVRDEGQPADSLKWFDLAIRTLKPVHDKELRDVRARQYLRNSHGALAATYDALAKHAEAVKDWDRVVELSPPPKQSAIRARRATSRVKAGQVAEAVAEVAELTKSSTLNAVGWFECACVCAVASSKIADKKKEYADRAMELLQQAVKAGWKDAAHIKKDLDLVPLQNRDDFKKLIADLEAKSK